MAATPDLRTVDAFLKPPEARGDFYYELRHGEMVKVTRPHFGRLLIQRNAGRCLERVIRAGGLSRLR